MARRRWCACHAADPFGTKRVLIALQFYRWLAVELLGCLIDIGTLGVATYFIWSLKMTVKKRLIVCSIFAIRVVM